jgi:hypothetical protein
MRKEKPCRHYGDANGGDDDNNLMIDTDLLS